MPNHCGVEWSGALYLRYSSAGHMCGGSERMEWMKLNLTARLALRGGVGKGSGGRCVWLLSVEAGWQFFVVQGWIHIRTFPGGTTTALVASSHVQQ